MWIDKPYSVDIELIALITGLPHSGIEPKPYLWDQDTTMIIKFKDKYALFYANKGFLISSIEDNSMRFPKCTVRIIRIAQNSVLEGV